MTVSILSWLKEKNVTWDDKLITINQSPYSVTAATDLIEGTVLCTIPKDLVLSIRTTAIADILEEEELGGVLGLCVAVCYELSIGSKSPWASYLSSLPSSSHLPIFWGKSDLNELKGTDLDSELVQLRVDMEQDYTDLVLPLFPKYSNLSQQLFSFDIFLNVAAWCTSRAFEVDAYHGESLVPFADLFNHHSDEHVHFTSDGDVCPHCGEVDGCDCEDVEMGMEEWEDEKSETDSVPELEESLPPTATTSRAPVSQILEMVTVRACAAGEQIYNTYGPHSNTSLLNRYGFVESNNPNSFISVSRESVLKLIAKSDDLEDRIAFWEQVGNAIVNEIEEAREHGEDLGCGDEGCDDDACGSKEHHIENGEEHEHEHANGCCDGVDDHKHPNGSEDEQEDEEMDEDGNPMDEEEDEEEEELEDDFRLHSTGPNFSLRIFMSLMHLPIEAFESITLDLNAAIPFMLEMSKSAYNPSPTEKELISSICRERIAAYPTTYKQDCVMKPASERVRQAVLLRMEEKETLLKFV